MVSRFSESNSIYGGIDGIGTTFAVMVAAIGSNQSDLTVITLALANILADGFSIGVSAYSSVMDNPDSLMALQKGITTFISFCLMGTILVIVYYFNEHHDRNKKLLLTIVTTLSCLFIIGMLKQSMIQDNYTIGGLVLGGLKTSFLGAMIGGISYLTAKVITEYQ